MSYYLGRNAGEVCFLMVEMTVYNALSIWLFISCYSILVKLFRLFMGYNIFSWIITHFVKYISD